MPLITDSKLPSGDFPQYLTRREIAEIFKISVRPVTRWETRDHLIHPIRKNNRVVRYKIEDIAALSNDLLLPVSIKACQEIGIPDNLILTFHLPSSCSAQKAAPGHQYLYRRQQISRELQVLTEEISIHRYPEISRALKRGAKTEPGAQLLDCLSGILAQAAHDYGQVS